MDSRRPILQVLTRLSMAALLNTVRNRSNMGHVVSRFGLHRCAILVDSERLSAMKVDQYASTTKQMASSALIEI